MDLKNNHFVATTYAGLEQVLAEELTALGADEVEPGRRSVYFTGDLELLYRANYSLRTALKVLMPLRTFRIKQVDDLYYQVSKIKWEDYFDQLNNQHEKKSLGFKIYGSDISRRNIDLACKNAENANVLHAVQLEIADFRFLEKKDKTSFLLFNPPYGERIQSGDPAFYSMIGERLKHHYENSAVWIMSTNECLKSIGLRPASKIPLYNGSLACSFREYKLYKGSKKTTD